MTSAISPSRARMRAPSKRSLATRERVLDAAERVFAAKGFDGATIRDIAAAADEPIGTIHHHGRGKENLFGQTVARRAETLSEHRIAALEAVKQDGRATVRDVLTAFFQPFFDLAASDTRWHSYARLVAFVSSDTRWSGLASECFDPTFERFMIALSELLPGTSRQQLAATFVFSVSAQLALLTSRDRIGAIGGGNVAEKDEMLTLIGFCADGMTGLAGGRG